MDNKYLFPNLEAEIVRANLSKQALAKIVEISTTSLYSKLNGKTEFNLGEMLSIKNTLEIMLGTESKATLTLDYLFYKGGN